MRRFAVLVMMVVLISPLASANSDVDSDGDGFLDEIDDCPQLFGTSNDSLVGCLDLDGDGISDPNDPDVDGDYYNNSIDDCPYQYGGSKYYLKGCPDMDGDRIPDIYDGDADGDGIRNEMERQASTGTRSYDPYRADSVPDYYDEDTIPDVLDDDADNDGILNHYEIDATRITGIEYGWLDDTATPPDTDGDGVPNGVDEDSDNDLWPDDVEIDRGSNPYDADETPHNMYFGKDTGFFYAGGFTTHDEYHPDEMEISISQLSEIVFEEMVIPLLLIPIYLLLHYARRNKFLQLESIIEREVSGDALAELELEVNELVRQRRIKVYHGLVLRNSIEAREGEIRRRYATIDGKDAWNAVSPVIPIDFNIYNYEEE